MTERDIDREKLRDTNIKMQKRGELLKEHETSDKHIKCETIRDKSPIT